MNRHVLDFVPQLALANAYHVVNECRKHRECWHDRSCPNWFNTPFLEYKCEHLNICEEERGVELQP